VNSQAGKFAGSVQSVQSVLVSAKGTPMEDAINNLRSAHERVANEIERTNRKFESVLRAPNPTAVSGADFPVHSALVDMINSAAAFLNSQGEKLCDINDRCTL